MSNNNYHKQVALLLSVIPEMFCIVGVEVLSVDSIINYAQFKGYSFKDAKYFATYTLIIMIIGYLCGIIAIPKLIIQRKVLQLCAVIGFFLRYLSLSCQVNTQFGLLVF